MKTLGWLVVMAVMVIGGRVEYGSPVRGARAPRQVETARPQVGERAVRAATAHLREEVLPGPDGTLVIANGAYRASFSARDGVSYTPRRAGTYDARLTWRYRARRLATDTGSRRLDDVAPAVSATGDHVVDFARPGFVERYEGEPGGVEQIFVLGARPAGGGDVRISGDVTFGGTIREKDGGLEFDAGGGLPTFTYAKPIAFDAKKAPVPVRVELSNRTLTLVLDGASLDRVQWPVTIDPLFGTTTVATASPTSTGLAYNADLGEFLVVYDTGDVIRGRRYHDHGDPVGETFVIATGGSYSMPSVAYDFHVHRYLVTWLHTTGPDAASVRARLLDRYAAPVGAEVGFGASATWFPDVAARNYREHGTNDLAFVVVWGSTQTSSSGRINAARIRGDGTVMGQGELNASQGFTPCVSYDPVADRFLVAYNDVVTNTARARVMSPSGVLSAEAEVAPINDNGAGVRHVAAAFDLASRRHLIVWAPVPAHTNEVHGRFYASATEPVPIGSEFTVGAVVPYRYVDAPSVVSETGVFRVVLESHDFDQDSWWTQEMRVRADGAPIGGGVLAFDGWYGAGTRTATGFHGFSPAGYSSLSSNTTSLALADRWSARYVHGGNAGDFDGDGRSDLFVYRQSTGKVYIKTQSGVSFITLAAPGGVPALLDYDGDGLTDIGIWEPGTGKWWIRTSNHPTIVSPQLGQAGDIPVPGDYYGLGEDQIAVFRPSTGIWSITPNNPHLAPIRVSFGEVGDLPAPADWDGDGDIDLGVWRPSTGRWYARDLQGNALPIPSTPWGQAGDIPLAGNFTGSSVADQAVYRKQLGVVWVRDGATGTTQTVTVGSQGIPVPLDRDGNGRLDLLMFDASSGAWRIDASTWVSFGAIGDIPAGAQ